MVKASEHSLKFSENLFTQYSIPNDRILGQGKLIVVFLSCPQISIFLTQHFWEEVLCTSFVNNKITYFRYSDAHKVEQENCCHSLQGRSIPHPRSTTSLSVHSSGLKWNLVSKQMQKKERSYKARDKRRTIIGLNSSVMLGFISLTWGPRMSLQGWSLTCSKFSG